MYKLAAPILFRTIYLECDGFPTDRIWEQERVYPTHFCIHVKAIIMVRPPRRFWGLNWTHFHPAFVERLLHLLERAENLQDLS